MGDVGRPGRSFRIRTLLLLVAGVAGACGFLRWALGRDDLARAGLVVLGIAVGFWVVCVEGFVLACRLLVRLLVPPRGTGVPPATARDGVAGITAVGGDDNALPPFDLR